MASPTEPKNISSTDESPSVVLDPKSLVRMLNNQQVQKILKGLLQMGFEPTNSKKGWRFVNRGVFELDRERLVIGIASQKTQKELEGMDLSKANENTWHFKYNIQQVLSEPGPSISAKEAKAITDPEHMYAVFSKWVEHLKMQTVNEAGEFLVAQLKKAKESQSEYLTNNCMFVQRLRQQFSEGALWYRPQWEESAASHYQSWSDGLIIKKQAKALNTQLSLNDYPALFPLARSCKRKITILTGPTNSGKSYAGFEALKKAQSGVYLAPLRLLALEGFERLSESGISTNLVTGEERKLTPGAKFDASTVEMMRPDVSYDVGVIDEAQMLGDDGRGWAWTQAICALAAKELYIISAPEGVSLVKKLLERLGEPYEIVEHTRKNDLAVAKHHVGLDGLKAGDALIAFSRKQVHQIASSVKEQGHSCALIYGSLAPEVRAAEALRFAKGDAQVLVATDAIGMGLNLPIDRIIFSTLEKFDGTQTKIIDNSLLLQIAGRAGRFGLSKAGIVSALGQSDVQHIGRVFGAPRKELSGKLQIAPNAEQIELMGKKLGHSQLSMLLSYFRHHLAQEDVLFGPPGMDDQIMLAQKADRYKNLTLTERFTYSKVPVDQKDTYHMDHLLHWMRSHHDQKTIECPSGPQKDTFGTDESSGKLHRYERHVRLLSAYCWLSYHFEHNYPERQRAELLRSALTGEISELLIEQNDNKQKHRSKGALGRSVKGVKGVKI